MILMQNRKLDRGNPNPGNIGADFAPFGLAFWDEVKRLDIRNRSRLNYLEDLNSWRNAIAHQDYSRFPKGSTLHFQSVKIWRSACNQLAIDFDAVLCDHVQSITGVRPWQ